MPREYTCLICGSTFTGKDSTIDPRKYCSYGCANKARQGGAEGRFWSRVNKADGCWEWQGPKRRGYGEIRIDGKRLQAHRFSWQLAYGPIPDGLMVCHHCDNRGCVRPNHLFLGTAADNMADRDAKGRHARKGPKNPARGIRNGMHTHPETRHPGMANANAKLTDADVLAIRSITGMTIRDIAKMYGVGRMTICYIRNGTSWKHLKSDH